MTSPAARDGQPAGPSAAPWGFPPEFADPLQLDPLLQRLARECSAYAVLLSRKGRIVAYAGSMPQAHASEIVGLLAAHAIREDMPGAVARFVRLPGAAEDFLLYALALNGEILLTLLYPARMPFSTVRVQAGRLEAVLTGMAPEPVRPPTPRFMGTIGSEGSPPSTLPRDWLPNREQARGELPHETGMGSTSPVVGPVSAQGRALPMAADRSAEAHEVRAPRMETDRAKAAQVANGDNRPPFAGRVTFGLVIAPRLTDHRLDGALAGRLHTWTARLCHTADARPLTIDVRPECLILTFDLPPQADPAAFVEKLQRDLSVSLLTSFPGLAASLPGAQFWAERYLLRLASPPPQEAIQAFLHELRLSAPPPVGSPGA